MRRCFGVVSVWFAAWSVTGGAMAQPAGGPPPAMVRLDAARMESVEPLRECRGELRSIRRSLIAAEEAGRVVELAVEEGDVVEQGDLLARLDATLMTMEVRRAEAEVHRREAATRERVVQLEKAERDAARTREMIERSSASQNENLDAQSLLESARARLAQAQAELEWAKVDVERLRKRLSDMAIAAPFAGRVVVKRTDLGQWVKEGDPVVELVDIHEVDAWLSVSQDFIEAVGQPGRTIQVRIEATGETLTAPVAAVVPAADALSRMFPVRVRLDNADGRLRPGMSVVGLAPTGLRAPMLTVHKDAILRDDAGAYVYFSAGGVAAVARVEPQFAVGDRVVVRAPALRDGAPVVVEGNERLTPGRPLIAQGGASPAGGPAADGKPGAPAEQPSEKGKG